MIRTWKHKGLKRFFLQGEKKHIQSEYRVKIKDILSALNVAEHINVMKVSSWRTHQHSGIEKNKLPIWSCDVDKRKGVRILFEWDEDKGEAYIVDLTNVHS